MQIHTLGMTLYLDEQKLNCPYMKIDDNNPTNGYLFVSHYPNYIK